MIEVTIDDDDELPAVDVDSDDGEFGHGLRRHRRGAEPRVTARALGREH